MKLLQGLKAFINRLLPRASFARSVGILVGGTAIAQAIGVMALPLITRLYTPEDFSLLAVFSSFVTIVSVAACLRLEIAIPLPEQDEDAINLLALSLFFCSLAAGLTGLIVLLFPNQITSIIRQPELKEYLWLIPLGVWLTSSYSAAQFWATRKKRFVAVAKTRMTQTIGSISIQVIYWLVTGAGSLGLLLGQTVYCGAGTLGLLKASWREDKTLIKKISFLEMRKNFKNYKNFPKYSTLEGFANSAATDIPILIIGSIIAGPEAGFLFLAMKIMVIPLGLIGRAIANVYFAHASEKHRKNELTSFTISTLDGLIKSGVGPLIFIGTLSPTIAPIVFGDEWRRAGEVILLLTPWFILQYISSPISSALHVTQNQKKAMVLQIAGVAIRVGATLFAALKAPSHIVEFYAISSALFYAIYFHIVCSSLKISSKDLNQLITKNFSTVLIWGLLGVASATLASRVLA